ncbi:MAG: class I SAM-dependent methyltransferase [Planctomycetota bacterium]
MAGVKHCKPLSSPVEQYKKSAGSVEECSMDTQAKCDQLVARLYKGVTLRDKALNEGIARRLQPGSLVLDAGCGCDAPIAGKHATAVSRCIGVDLVEEFTPPPGVDLIRADLNHLPFRSGTFDLIFSRSVLEHLKEPGKTFQEFSRVLKPGGAMVLVTPNKYDYASLLARAIPNRMHDTLLKQTQGEDVYDNFPTYFRCNTRRAIRKAVQDTGLRIMKMTFIRHYPYYLMFSVPLFYLGVAYDRFITKLGLSFLQPSIYMEIEKEA